MNPGILSALLVVLVSIILVARGLARSAWALTLFGLFCWWIGTIMLVVTLDLIAISATISILTTEPMFDFKIEIPHEFEPRFESPPPKVDKEA